MRDMGRTSPKDALERLSWHLNYHQNETVSLNQISEATGLSWATVHKYAQVIENVQKIAPQISLEESGLSVGHQSKIMAEAFKDPSSALAMYLLLHAEIEGGATFPIDKSEHQQVLEEFSDTLEKLEGLGWVESTDDEISLTQLGVQIVGPLRSEIKNTSRDPSSSQIQVYKQGSSVVAVNREPKSQSRDTENKKAERYEPPASSKTKAKWQSNAGEFTSSEYTLYS
ncbi:hypothetical protein [Haloferax sp. Atlit-6N]|uniref:hypothetical protein n=1 Tax=Haloferax sp. Atlit-6N TaxID=2077205 RepID=UPI0011C04AFE|nr:hypothetical protein [Haloferax sp. Atlit-6N]